MDSKKIKDIKTRLAKLRKKVANIRSRELESLAKSLGRIREERGKHPTWISKDLPNAPPITVPNHPGALNKYTAGNILDQLEQDLFTLEEIERQTKR